jgi:hypothetical protein
MLFLNATEVTTGVEKSFVTDEEFAKNIFSPSKDGASEFNGL